MNLSRSARSQRESPLLRRILATLSHGSVRLFRNNVAVAYQGIVSRAPPDPRWDRGSIIIQRPRVIRSGLAVGSADLIGLRAITITPEMVGRCVAVFASIEVKARGGHTKREQRAWAEAIRSMGGIAGTVRSIEEAKKLLSIEEESDPEQVLPGINAYEV